LEYGAAMICEDRVPKGGVATDGAKFLYHEAEGIAGLHMKRKVGIHPHAIFSIEFLLPNGSIVVENEDFHTVPVQMRLSDGSCDGDLSLLGRCKATDAGSPVPGMLPVLIHAEPRIVPLPEGGVIPCFRSVPETSVPQIVNAPQARSPMRIFLQYERVYASPQGRRER